MIAKEARDFVRAVGNQFPRYNVSGLKELLAGGRWQVGLDSRDFFGAPEFRRLDNAGRPVSSFRWDMRKGARSETRSLVPPKVQRFAPDWFEDKDLSRVVSDFHALCPVESILTSGKSWSLKLARPEPWPRFCRLALADPFLPQSTPLAYLLLDRAVAELSFEEDRLCAYLAA